MQIVRKQSNMKCLSINNVNRDVYLAVLIR